MMKRHPGAAKRASLALDAKHPGLFTLKGYHIKAQGRRLAAPWVNR